MNEQRSTRRQKLKKITELKNTITEIKFTRKYNSRFEMGEERISETEDRAIEIIQSEELTTKRNEVPVGHQADRHM